MSTNPVPPPNQGHPQQPQPNVGRYKKIPAPPKFKYLTYDNGNILSFYQKAMEIAQKAKGHDIVAFVGRTGKGKSTCIHSVMGSKLVLDGGKVITVLPNIPPIIGTARKSESIFAETFDVKDEAFKVTDTGGFCDTFGTLQDTANAISMYLTCQAANSVRFVMCCSMGDFNETRDEIKKPAHALHEMILDGPLSLRDSVVLLVTRSENFAEDKRDQIVREGIQETCQTYPDLCSFFDRIKKDNRIIYDPTKQEHRDRLITAIKLLPPITDKKAIRVGYPDAGELLEDFLRVARYEIEIFEEYFENLDELVKVNKNIADLDEKVTKLDLRKKEINSSPQSPVNPEEEIREYEKRLSEVSDEIARLTQCRSDTIKTKEKCVKQLEDLRLEGDKKKPLKTLTLDLTGITRAKQLGKRRILKSVCDEEIGGIKCSDKISTTKWWRTLEGGIGTKVFEVRFRSVRKFRKEHPKINQLTITLYSKKRNETEVFRKEHKTCEDTLVAALRDETSLSDKILKHEKDKIKFQTLIKGTKDNTDRRTANEKHLELIQDNINEANRAKSLQQQALASIEERNKELKKVIDANAEASSVILKHVDLCNDIVSRNSEIIKFIELKKKFNQ